MEILFEQFQETAEIPLPNNMGITGLAYGTQQIFVCNNTKLETRYRNEIDNQSNQKSVSNFMIGPVFGHDRDVIT